MPKEGIELAKRTIDLAVKPGVTDVVNSIAEARDHDKNLSQFMNQVGEAGDYAREHGVIIGIEVHGNYTGNSKNGLAVIREVNHPLCKNCLRYHELYLLRRCVAL